MLVMLMVARAFQYYETQLPFSKGIKNNLTSFFICSIALCHLSTCFELCCFNLICWYFNQLINRCLPLNNIRTDVKQVEASISETNKLEINSYTSCSCLQNDRSLLYKYFFFTFTFVFFKIFFFSPLKVISDHHWSSHVVNVPET